MKEIQLTRGKVALVDDDDFESLSQFRWHFTTWGYACRNASRKGGASRRNIFMHREILGSKCEGLDVDHINGNGCDNRKVNIRACRTCENLRNRGAQRNNTTGVKGVTLRKYQGGQGYIAQIKKDGEHHYLGFFKTLEEAAAVRFEASLRMHGEFAHI